MHLKVTLNSEALLSNGVKTTLDFKQLYLFIS